MTRHWIRRSAALAVVGFALAATIALAGPRPELDATAGLHPVAASHTLALRARSSASLLARATPSSFDERYDVPTFMWATRGSGSPSASAARAAARPTAEAAARAHLGEVSGFYRLQAADVAGAPLRYVHDIGRGGIIAAFNQSVDGIDVFRDEVKVLMDRNLELIAVSGYIPSRELVARTGTPVFKLSAEHALNLALDDFAGRPTGGQPPRFTQALEGGYLQYDVSAAAASLPEGLRPGGPVRVKQTLFHMPDALVPAWYVELMSPDQSYMYVVDATDGHLLFRHDLMAFDAFSYRVWAQTSGNHLPDDGPQGTSPTPHPTGLPDFFVPPFTAPSLVTLQNGPLSTNDPWLPAGATVTTGNNVDAYADIASPDGFSAGDLRPTVTSPGAFDRVFDVNQSPSASTNQRMAAVTQMFYNDNFFHDWYYDSGFNEAAGNGQTNNFGRGGLGSDAMHAEGQDYSGTNNANMSTPPDGAPGRMQMYVFTPAGVSQLNVSAPAGVAGSYAVGVATGFGPQAFNVTGSLIVGVDGIAPIEDGCSGLANAAQVVGKIVMIDRGTCSFLLKAQNAQGAGAIGVIIADNVAAPTPPAMGGTGGGVTIPVLSVTLATANALKAALAGNPVTLQLLRQASLNRDGTIDNQVMAHEWGHFISNRLIGNAAGLSTSMASGLGEGWADFHAMLLTVRPEDILAPANANWTGVYSLAGYALTPSVGSSNFYYFGIRRVPYSTDLGKNALTFHHIEDGIPLPVGPPTAFGQSGTDNAEVHNTGEVWCTMLWECYAALLRDSGRLTFAQAQQHMKDELVAAYKLTPNAPTLLEARDALLAAAYAMDPNDFHEFWTAFARRGAGVGALAPNRFDGTNAGVVESYLTGGDLAVVSKTLNVDVHDCDGDGYLDNGEVGHVTLTLKNTGSAGLSHTTLSLSSANGHVGFPGGNAVPFPSLAPLGSGSVTLPVELLGAVGPELLDIVATYNDPGLASAGPRTSTLYAYGNTDEVPSASENVETLTPPWTASGTPLADGQWTTAEAGPTDHRFRGPDVGEVADHALTSPPLQVAASGNFTFSFQTAWDFETDGTNFYDGGVVEISTDNGVSWNDVGVGALSPGYLSTLYVGSGNPLGGRGAYTGQSPGFPALIAVNANLGTAYAGQTVRIRFRIASDVGVGATGWDIASLAFNNLTNLPFFDIGTNAVDCTPVAVGPGLPIAVAFSVWGANPATGSARFRYGLPSAARVDVSIYDVSGRRVATLAGGEQAAGWHLAAWTVNDDGSAPSSGVYFARFTTNGRALNSRVVMMR
jgi:hypothetical protein